MVFNAQLPGNSPGQVTVTPRRGRPKTTLIEDDSFVVLNQVPLNGTQTFTVTASGRKRYTGNIINDGPNPIQVQIETTRKRLSLPITLKVGDSLDFDRYPLSSMTLTGVSTFTFSGWASGERYGGYVKRISSAISSSSTTINQVEIIDSTGAILGVFPTLPSGAYAMPIRQLTAALDTVTANQGTSPWITQGTDNISQIGGTSVSGLINAAGPQINTLPTLKGLTTIAVEGYAANTTTTFYTVPVGLTFYMTLAAISTHFNTATITSYGYGYFLINGNVIITLNGQDSIWPLSTPAGLPFPAGTTFGVFASNSVSATSAYLAGWTQ